MNDLKGMRVWKIDEKTRIPEMIWKGNPEEIISLDDLWKELKLDLENKTYAIRLGKTGLK